VAQVFFGNWVIIQAFRGRDPLSSLSGAELWLTHQNLDIKSNPT